MTGLQLDGIGEWTKAQVYNIIFSVLHTKHNLYTEDIDSLEFTISYDFNGDTAIITVFQLEYLADGLVIQLPITY